MLCISATTRPLRRLDVSRFASPVLTVLGVLAAFQLAVELDVLPAEHFPTVTAVVRTLADTVVTSSFWSDVADTATGWALGLGIAICIALPVGMLFGSSWIAFRATRPVVEFLRPVPSVALIPLTVLVFGTGMESKLFLVAYASTWPLLLATIYGVRDLDPVLIDSARTLGLTRWQRISRVAVPSSVPYVATGLRVSSAIALVLAITAELVIGAPGVGKTIGTAQAGGNVELMYAMIVVAGGLGWALNVGLRRLEGRLLHWHVSQRAPGGAS
jgi:ABC-type nitrate/sulfonate/bicarbonate transport system permease component